MSEQPRESPRTESEAQPRVESEAQPKANEPAASVSPAESQQQPAKDEKPWYRDPSKVVGVLGFVLALGTLGERMWVREQEQTLQQLQQLREVMAGLADIQVEYLQMLAQAPSNIYPLNVAKNTKRQMYLQTAAALLEHRGVKAQASSQIYGALGGEMMNDGRHEAARTYFTQALNAAGADETTRPYILRALGRLYRIPDTPFANPATARDYYDQALKILDKRPDDTGHLAWAETVLTEADLEMIVGERERAKTLARQAQDRLRRVRSLSPLKAQLEFIAAAFARGEPFPQTQNTALQPPAAIFAPPTIETRLPSQPSDGPGSTSTGATDAPPARDQPAVSATLEIWAPIPGQLSGAEMDVAVDGKPVGHISNLTDSRQLKLPPLAAGVHRFAFTNIKAYLVDFAKQSSMTAMGGSCRGLFELAQASVLKITVLQGPNGLVCALQ